METIKTTPTTGTIIAARLRPFVDLHLFIGPSRQVSEGPGIFMPAFTPVSLQIRRRVVRNALELVVGQRQQLPHRRPHAARRGSSRRCIGAEQNSGREAA